MFLGKVITSNRTQRTRPYKTKKYGTWIKTTTQTHPATDHDAATADGDKIYLETSISCPEDCARKIPWLYIILLLIFLGAGIWYINFYRGRFKLRTITEKRLFKSKVDYKNLYGYVKKAKKEGFMKDEITNTLIKKGWTKEQISFIFKKLEPKFIKNMESKLKKK